MAKTMTDDLAMDQVAGVTFQMIDAYNVIVDGAEPRTDWWFLPEDEQAMTMQAVTALRDAPEISPQQNHERWVEIMLERGWTIGPEVDLDRKEHPFLIPFEELPPAAKRMNYANYLIVLVLSRPIEELEKVEWPNAE